MKFALVLATVLVAASAVPHPRMVEQEWNSFKSKHVKVYNSADEEAKRLAIFHQNLIKIEEHNKLYEQGLSTYKMGVTPFADMTSEEFRAYVNKSGVQSRPQVGGEKVVLSSMNAPKSMDWRTKNVLTPIKDQGECGSCWSFAATGAMEAHYAIKSGKLISLSEQQLMDCSKDYGNNGCHGGIIDAAYKYVHDHYITYENNYPYKERIDACHKAEASPVKVAGFVDLSGSSENIRNAVAKGPVSASVDATDAWHLYEGGVLEDATCEVWAINHGILVVGYDEDGEYYIIKNSWGSGWGENGYIRFSYKHRCGIEDSASYPVIE